MFNLFKYKLNAGLISDIGKARFENQDNFSLGRFINTDKKEHVEWELKGQKFPQAYAVMDGMGGEKLGAQASLEVAGFFSYICRDILADLNAVDEKNKELIFKELIYTLNERVRKMAGEHKVRQSGTTLAAIFFINNKVYVLSVGDSEVFLIRNKNISRLNRLDYLSVTLADENESQRKMKLGLSQFLGMDTTEYEFHLSIKELSIENDDSFLICSDGLTDYVKDTEIAEITHEYKLMDSIKILLGLAMERGGKDNTTILRIDIVETIF